MSEWLKMVVSCMYKLKRRGIKMGQKIYMMVDNTEEHLPLIVGTSREVSDYAGITPESLRKQIYLNKKRGGFCKYLVIGKLDD